MRFVSFYKRKAIHYGLVDGSDVIDLVPLIGDRTPDLKSLIAGDGFETALEAASSSGSRLALADLEFAPVIPNPDKILCIGINYDEHRKETGREQADYPVVFTRFADTQVGHGGNLIRPKASAELDYEGELAVVIGRPGRHIRKEDALNHVAGYSIYNDASVRDWQRHTSQFTPGKNFPGTGGLGPWLVSGDEIPDPQALEVTTRLNGEVMQHAETDLMIFDVASIIEYCSAFTSLSPGDVIATGTPGGVGFKRDPQVFMAPGDVVEVEISVIGLLSNGVVAETRNE